jgi:hypothetical protein
MAAAYAPRSRLDFFQRRGERLGVCVSKVFGEDQKVSAFLNGPLGYIHEPSLVRFAATVRGRVP